VKFSYRTVAEKSTYSHVDVLHWLCTVRERTGSIDVLSFVISGTKENTRIKRQCTNRDKEKKRQSKKKNARYVRSEAASIYLRFEVTKIISNVGDYLPWIFSNTNLKISKVGNKKQKQNNVDHSSQLLLTQGVLCYSRRRKKSLLWEQNNKELMNSRKPAQRDEPLWHLSCVSHFCWNMSQFVVRNLSLWISPYPANSSLTFLLCQ